MIYDVCVIGSGPAGLFAAMEIVGHSDLEVLVLEKARRLNDSRNVAMGWLGGSARATVKMFVDPQFGGEVATDDLIATYMNRLESYGSTKLKINKKRLLKRSIKRANDLDIKVDEPNTIIYTEDKMIKLGEYLYSYLRNNATVTHKIDVSNIEHKGGIYHITTQEDVFQAKKIIMGLGRSGAYWLLDQNFFSFSHSGQGFDLGVRLEFPNYTLKEFSSKSKNFRFRYGNFRTTVPIFSGTVETEEVGHIKVSNGRGWGGNKTPLANMAVLRRFETETPLADIYRISEIINVLSDGQLLRDSLGRVLGDSLLANHLPEFQDVILGAEKLVQLFPNMKKRCTVYAPEARLNAVSFKLDNYMQSEMSGFYIVGDMSGKTSSFVQAACSGLLAADHILKESGVRNG